MLVKQLYMITNRNYYNVSYVPLYKLMISFYSDNLFSDKDGKCNLLRVFHLSFHGKLHMYMYKCIYI